MKWTHKRATTARFVLILFSGFRGEGLDVKVYDDDGHQVMAKAHMIFYQVDKQTHTASFWCKARNLSITTIISTTCNVFGAQCEKDLKIPMVIRSQHKKRTKGQIKLLMKCH